MITTLLRVKNWLLHFTHINLIIALTTLPFLCAWGLPLSTLTLVGNLIFAPFLALFLCICSGLFITQLLGIPPLFLPKLLDVLTTCWLFCMRKGSSCYYICFPTALFYPLCILAALTLLFLYHQWLGKREYHLPFTCAALALAVYVTSGYKTWWHGSLIVTNNKKTLSIVKQDNMLIVKNEGAFEERNNAQQFVQYKLLPALCKQTGTLSIDTLELFKFCPKTQKALEQLLETAPIKNIILSSTTIKKSEQMLFKEFIKTHPAICLKQYAIKHYARAPKSHTAPQLKKQALCSL